jgi:hypothetical protein
MKMSHLTAAALAAALIASAPAFAADNDATKQPTQSYAHEAPPKQPAQSYSHEAPPAQAAQSYAHEAPPAQPAQSYSHSDPAAGLTKQQ